jgi:hypothetical protein
MRLHLSLLFSAALLSGCAYEGTIVDKSHQPHPMYLSQGIEGKYTFVVQDKAGVRHRQMVTPEVFERYAIGQYFNDQETGPTGGLDDGKTSQSDAMTASNSAVGPVRYASKQPTGATSKAAAVRNAVKRIQRVAATAKAKTKTRRSNIAAAKRKRSKPTKSSVTVAHVTPAAPAVAAPAVAAPATPSVEITPTAAPSDADFRVVTVARCR